MWGDLDNLGFGSGKLRHSGCRRNGCTKNRKIEISRCGPLLIRNFHSDGGWALLSGGAQGGSNGSCSPCTPFAEPGVTCTESLISTGTEPLSLRVGPVSARGCVLRWCDLLVTCYRGLANSDRVARGWSGIARCRPIWEPSSREVGAAQTRSSPNGYSTADYLTKTRRLQAGLKCRQRPALRLSPLDV
jgi:hypothetical protein